MYKLWHSDKIGRDGKKYVTCMDCDHLGIGGVDHFFCDVMVGTIREPGKSWCKIGIVSSWIKNHKPIEVIELLQMC